MCLYFRSLESGNIAYKLMNRLGGAEAIGPILMGVDKSIHVLQRNCEVNDIVNMTAIAVLDAQKYGRLEIICPFFLMEDRNENI